MHFPLDQRELLHLHIEAVWNVQLPHSLGDEVVLPSTGLQPAWKLYIAELAENGSCLYIWRSEEERAHGAALVEMAKRALAAPHDATLPDHISREVAFQQTATPVIALAHARQFVRLIAADETQLFEAFEPGSSAYYADPTRQPLCGVVHEGQLRSLAHSSRHTSAACELGIGTLPEARRQGYALAATIAWTETVRQEGLVPIYSALSENTVSLKLAHAAGYREFARGVNIQA
jgi:GNAT superfamily N-acetyltransferase